MFDDWTERDMYNRYVFERIKSLQSEFPEMLNVIAQKWRDENSDLPLSEYACKQATAVTGIPDYEHFLVCELHNTRIIHYQVEAIPPRIEKIIGMTLEESMDIHREECHRPTGANERFYRPGRF